MSNASHFHIVAECKAHCNMSSETAGMAVAPSVGAFFSSLGAIFNRAGCIFPTDDADHVSRHQFPHALAPRAIGFFPMSHPDAAHVINRAILCEKDHKKWSPRLALPPRSQSSHGPCREVTSTCHKMSSPMPKQVITDVTSGDIVTKISTSLKPRFSKGQISRERERESPYQP